MSDHVRRGRQVRALELRHGTSLAGKLLALGYRPGILVVGFGYTLFGHPRCALVMLLGYLAALVLDRMVLAR